MQEIQSMKIIFEENELKDLDGGFTAFGLVTPYLHSGMDKSELVTKLENFIVEFDQHKDIRNRYAEFLEKLKQ